MFEEFHSVQLQNLSKASMLVKPDASAERVDINSTATKVMTDFKSVPPVTVDEHTLVNDALEVMKTQHVRLLFAVNANCEVQGIITAADIMGVKPMAYAQSNGMARNMVEVKHIMLARDDISALSWRQIQQIKIGDVILTLQGSGSQHLLILDEDEQGMQKIRGVISASDISRKLKISFDVMHEAKTFAEIEHIVTHRDASSQAGMAS